MDDEDTPPTQPGRPLSPDELRVREERRQRRLAGVPVPVDREGDSTARIARRLFAGLQRRSPTEDVETLVDRFASKVAERSKRDTESAVKKTGFHDWTRTAVSLIGLGGMLLAAWIGLRDEVRSRPTSADVKEAIAPIHVRLADQDREQRAQRDVMIELGGAVKGLTEAVGDLKKTVAQPGRRRAP